MGKCILIGAGGGAGKVKSVQISAQGPVISSVSTVQEGIVSTQISLADGYGDTKNPYGTKNKNLVLASDSQNNGIVPSFRALTVNDLPIIPASKGGTGWTSAPVGALLIGDETGLWAKKDPSSGAFYSTGSTPQYGTLPVAQGGTGQTTLAAARNAMGLGNTTDALPIANGGTGSTTAANAKTALGINEERGIAYCSTAAATAAKTASYRGYKLETGYFLLFITATNTSASALTLNVNSTGAKNLYINGTISSSSNYGLAKGMHICYYNSTDDYYNVADTNKYYSGTSTPSANYGANGDIYIQYTA